ncbi:MAG: Asp-tRNA(Asn)/Glu-tRNA(Gln) amidotransferase subunit GatC [Planctomycetota bacterium]
MSETIDLDRVRHIGKLSRIELSEQEVETLSRQLGSLLTYFDKLQQLDTEGVAPMPHAVELRNVLADDQVRPGLTTEQALANAPAEEDDLFRVPKVLGESQ